MSAFKYGVLYTDGGARNHDAVPGSGWGVHGYFFDTLPGVRFANADVLFTPEGYVPKPTGDQLKNESYNPTYSQWGYSINLKDSPVIKDCDTVIIIDGWQGGVVTAQRAEVLAFLNAIESCPLTAEYYLVFSDSQYFVDGYNKNMATWRQAGWRKADGDSASHPDLWERVFQIKERFGDKIAVKKIKAHDGHFGNESADRCATFGVIQAINAGGIEQDPVWRQNPVGNGQYWTIDKAIPNVIRTKWCYSFTGRPRRQTEVDTVMYHHYFVGDHSKSKDDIELLGKKKSDTGFGLILLNDTVPVITRVEQHHQENMWETKNIMYQSEVVNMINLANLMLPKVLWEEMHGSAEVMWLKNHRNDLLTRRDEVISKMLRPPKLSYRIEEEEELLRTVLFSHLLNQGRVIPECKNFTPLVLETLEVTDKFYSTTLKKDGSAGQTKMTDFYNATAKSIKLDLPNPCTDKFISTVFARGIDLPTRNMMAGLASDNPRVYAVTWRFSKISFRYALIIETCDSFGIWCGNYRNYRHLDREQDPIKD